MINFYRKNKGNIPEPIRRAMMKIGEVSGITDFICQMQVKKFYSKINWITPGDLIYDVGANIGDYTGIFVSKGAKVVAIEPQPEIAKILKKNYPRIIVIEKGISDKDGELELQLCRTNGASTFSSEWKKLLMEDGRKNGYERGFVGRIKVPVTTLEAIIEEYGVPKYCKIDVEGYEEKVLLGLKTRIPYMSFECHATLFHEIEKCVDIIEKNGTAKYNYTDWYSAGFCLNEWTDASSIIRILKDESRSKPNGGWDIFVKTAP